MIMLGIPTCMRPLMLSACLQSIGEMTLPTNATVRLVVADNDKAQSARAVVQEFSANAPFAVEYTVCPERGLSNIRNHLLDYAVTLDADYLACTDDDCTVKPNWLAGLYAEMLAGGVDAMGPGAGSMQNPRLPTENIMLSARLYRDMGVRYDPHFNFTGSEDSDFARRAIKAGARFADSPRVSTHIPIGEHREGWGIYIRHHYARIVMATYVNRIKHGRHISYILVDAVIYLIKGTLLIPFAIFSRQQRKRCFKSFIKAVAYPRSLFGAGKYEPYRKISGR